ncbi:glycosyltransferase family 2 protein [Chelativorans sp. YIM 93263]|uniref:glycosyltransferase family 2 protein n=1 Tax=Chelativorans sp. YIM 93263 TaxID=2906648 RepID=UPI002377F3B7|nr:glycosyltransferase family 2 protein [Chelativorans sp. YIM 93263]
MGVSVLIMTWNEEANLPACLESLAWSDDIVVLDSFSTDRTVEIAKAAGVRVIKRKYDTEDRQRMFGLTKIKFKHPWVYTPDADEVTPPELRDEMLAIAADPECPEAMFKARYKNMFLGKWIRHSSLYPTWITRMVRPDRVRFERQVHSVCVADGPTGQLKNHFIHYSFNKGIAAWYEKHNRYSSVEADLAANRAKQKVDWADLFSPRADARRRGLKSLSYKLPFRPTLRFLYMYVLRGGFLDGWPGYVYCRLISGYEFMIIVKTAELQRRDRGLQV